MQSAQPGGYLAVPPSGAGPGVLVLHAWWGLNDTIKGTCDRLATEGFVAYAPDLFGGKVASTIEEADLLSSAADAASERVISDIARAADLLANRANTPGLGIIAFSFGAYYGLNLSAESGDRVRAVVLFYGCGDAEFSRSRSAYQGHFAEHDPYESAENVNALEAQLRAAGRPVEFYRYEGVGHWFFEPDRTDAYNEPAATLAWERTLDFLKQTLQPRPHEGAPS